MARRTFAVAKRSDRTPQAMLSIFGDLPYIVVFDATLSTDRMYFVGWCQKNCGGNYRIGELTIYFQKEEDAMLCYLKFC